MGGEEETSLATLSRSAICDRGHVLWWLTGAGRHPRVAGSRLCWLGGMWRGEGRSVKGDSLRVEGDEWKSWGPKWKSTRERG